tara:strand:- start:1793 stop:2128 length:336 start_codon:yes stop_codon:yes gene_type:complete
MILINMVDVALILVSLVFGIAMGFMVRYFTGIYEAQFTITDKLIHKVNDLRNEVAEIRGHSKELVDDFDITGNEVMQHIRDDDSERTHILGGFVQGDAVCADECWCNGEEE